MKKIYTIFVAVAIFHILSAVSTENLASNPEISTTGGLLRGQTTYCGLFCKYYSFKGIPFAEPPINDLRFRAPLPHSGWAGIFEANRHGKNCPSSLPLGGINFGEDCLTLNVYTKSLNQNLPVMVWLHGGGFYMGSGNDLIYGPDYFVDDGVIVVTINYRLGVLGFFSTNDNNAPGNYGLKDCVLALKWIQDNIVQFGGDPSRVTIYGESSGSAFVHYLILSPITSGLFARAISQSGTALNPWAYQRDPIKIAHQLAKKLGITFSDNESLVNQLRQVSSMELALASSGGYSNETTAFGILIFPFSPTMDPANVSSEEVFLPDTPLKLMQSGAFNQVPYIIGFNSAESIYIIREIILDPQIFRTINANPSLLIPRWWNVHSNELDEMAQKILDFYFNGTNLNYSIRHEYSQYVSDLMFFYGITETARHHAAVQIPSAPIFMYRFGYDGSFNLFKAALFLKDYPGAMHAEELFYMWKIAKIPSPPLPGSSVLQMRRLMVRMWTNFARDGNPTPSSDLITNTKWIPIDEDQKYLSIDTQVTAENYPYKNRMNFWKQLDVQYNQN